METFCVLTVVVAYMNTDCVKASWTEYLEWVHLHHM